MLHTFSPNSFCIILIYFGAISFWKLKNFDRFIFWKLENFDRFIFLITYIAILMIKRKNVILTSAIQRSSGLLAERRYPALSSVRKSLQNRKRPGQSFLNCACGLYRECWKTYQNHSERTWVNLYRKFCQKGHP